MARASRRITAALTLASVGSAALAASAGAASLKITMPSQVKRGADYTIQINGSYKHSELKGRAYLISTIQFANHPCRKTAQAENRSPYYLQWYFTPKSEQKLKHPKHVGIFAPPAPFVRSDAFTAVDLGTRHVCAWLYPKFIHAGDSLTPIARADKRYRVVK